MCSRCYLGPDRWVLGGVQIHDERGSVSGINSSQPANHQATGLYLERFPSSSSSSSSSSGVRHGGQSGGSTGWASACCIASTVIAIDRHPSVSLSGPARSVHRLGDGSGMGGSQSVRQTLTTAVSHGIHDSTTPCLTVSHSVLTRPAVQPVMAHGQHKAGGCRGCWTSAHCSVLCAGVEWWWWWCMT